MSYVDDAFENLKSNLEITPTESSQAQTRHKAIRDHIRSKWTLTDDFLTGSYRRDTKTKKLKDVDLFVVVDREGPQASLSEGTGLETLAALRDLLATEWDDLKTDDNVVTINYSGDDVASYEVAPVFLRNEGGYLMPSGATWMATDPTIHEQLVTDKNKECDKKFVPFVKMVKGINRETGEPIDPSFLIEVMALDLVFAPFGRYREEIRFFLSSAVEHIVHDWPDPAGLGSDINAAQTPARRSELASIITGWQTTVEEALLLEGEGKERAAVEKWRELFGWRMPRP